MARPASLPQPATRQRLAVSTALFSIATGFSRIAGLLREIIAAAIFAVTGEINAFTAAQALPNLVRALVADAALGAAFVPIFNQLLENDERERAWRVASTVFWLSFAGLSGITVLFMIFAPQIMELYGLGGNGFDVGLAATLARIMFPIVVLLGLSGLINAILNTFGEFFVPAIAPVAWNAILIGALILCVPITTSTETRLVIYAVGLLVATAVQFAIPLPWLRGRGGHISLHIDIHDPMVARVFVLMLPVTLGLGLVNVNLVVDQFFASLGNADLWIAAMDKAFRIYMLPQGIFSVAVAAVLFPTLSRIAAAGEMQTFARTVASGLRQIAFLLIPASVACAVLAEPMVRLFYQHGSFDSSDTHTVAMALVGFSVGLAFNGAMLLLIRSFFSLQMTWTPTIIALANLFVNAILDAVLYRFGVWGIPLSTSIVNMLGVAALVWYLRRVVGSLDGHRTVRLAVRVAVASAFLGVVAFCTWSVLDTQLGQSLPAQVVSLGGGLALGGATYLSLCSLMRVEELDVLTALVHR